MSTIEPSIQSQSTNDPTINQAEANAYNILLDVAQKRPKLLDNVTSFFNKFNMIFAFAFDSLLFYTPGLTETPPDVVSFITKILVIGVSYLIINIVLSIFIYSIFIPIFYDSYAKSYSCFQTYVHNQYIAYQAKFGVKLLEQSGDLKTMGILAVFNTVANTKYNTAKNIDEYKSFIYNNIDAALKRLKDPVLDTETIQKIKDYFMGLPDEFKKHTKLKEIYVYQTIQLWVIMLCTILFVIPIKYTIIDNANKPKLPAELTNAMSAMKNRVSKLTNKTIDTIMPGPNNIGVPPPAAPIATI